MPISTNAPFNEFGQSMILRDIEQLYLALNGAGTGSPGDGQTQDQSAATSQDSGGVPDLSGLATATYVDNAIAAIPATATYDLHAFGNLTPSSGTNVASYTDTTGNAVASLSGNTFTVPASGVYTIVSRLFGNWGGAPPANLLTTITRDGASVPLKSTAASSAIGSPVFTVSGVAPVWTSYSQNLDATAVWTSRFTAGETISITHFFSAVASLSNVSNRLLVSGISP